MVSACALCVRLLVAAMFGFCAPQFLNVPPYHPPPANCAAAALIGSGQATQLCLVPFVTMMMTVVQLHHR